MNKGHVQLIIVDSNVGENYENDAHVDIERQMGTVIQKNPPSGWEGIHRGRWWVGSTFMAGLIGFIWLPRCEIGGEGNTDNQ